MDQIFVQIASYRDRELTQTIRNCLANAKFPERLTFGICWQYDERTFGDLDPFLPDKRFRIDQIYFRDSKGCCWARHRTNRLYDNEEYTLQIDAHTRFTRHWDAKCIEMARLIEHEKPILTTYPPPYEKVNGHDYYHIDQGIQRLNLVRLRRNLTTIQTTECAGEVSRPGKSPLVAAGFLFTLGTFCREVEYDPEMYFNGEEISLAARAYTTGYNFYYPNRIILWHLYRHRMPLHWTDHGNKHASLHDRSILRLRALLLGNHSSLTNYGLGCHRTLSEFEEYAGLNFRERVERKRNPVTFRRQIQLATQEIESRDDYDYWIFCLLDEDDEEIYRYDIRDKKILNKNSSRIKIETTLPDRPVSYMLWPYSRTTGYGRKLIRELHAN